MKAIKNITTKTNLARQAMLAYAFLYAFMFNLNIDNINSVVSWVLAEAYQKLTQS